MKTSYLLAALLLAFGSNASATDRCTPIDSLPASLTASGKYCLSSNLASSTYGIVVRADDVTIDCGGRLLDGSSSSPASAVVGILASNRRNVTVRHCTVKGFAEGIVLTGSGHIVDDTRVTGSWARGIRLAGSDNTINDAWVGSIGGTTNSAFFASGIIASGTTDVRGTTVSGVTAVPLSGRGAYGIYTTRNDGGTIIGNTVRNLIADSNGINLAVSAYNSTNAVMLGNQASNAPSSYGYAFYCSGAGSTMVDNVAQGYQYGTNGVCYNGGGNVER